ncbi:MAG: hypothetical protein QY312_00305 [Candidatus Dojkabacteria bacterium]|nr:MAG: hypothetical protein QY312_00305 [Candidatus Dojkabacteria bacterium]
MLLTAQLALLFVALWVSSSVIIKSVTKLSVKAKLPTFLVSFFLLGFLTSISEISVAISSYLDGVPQISAGNLLGGIIVMFLLVLPLLAILGNGISAESNYKPHELFITLTVLVLPALLFLDKQITPSEGYFLLGSYLIPVIILVAKNSDLPAKKGRIPNAVKSTNILLEIAKIVLGGVVLLYAADHLVDLLVISAQVLGITPFILSLLTLSLGTNLPEIILVIKAVLTGNKEVALGNYIGSALMNLLILSFLAIANGGLSISADFTKIFIFTSIGLVLFFSFITSKNVLTRKEGILLLLLYVAFLWTELL